MDLSKIVYNPHDFTPYPSKFVKHEEKQDENKDDSVPGLTVFYFVNTTHRMGICRTKVTMADRRAIESRGEEFLDSISSHYFKNPHIKELWRSTRCRETDDDIYTIVDLSEFRKNIYDERFFIVNTIFNIPLRPNPVKPPLKQVTWSMMVA